MTQFEKLDLLLRECGGTLQTFQVLDNGIGNSVFYAYVKERGLEQAAHGVYVSPDTWTDAMLAQARQQKAREQETKERQKADADRRAGLDPKVQEVIEAVSYTHLTVAGADQAGSGARPVF